MHEIAIDKWSDMHRLVDYIKLTCMKQCHFTPAHFPHITRWKRKQSHNQTSLIWHAELLFVVTQSWSGVVILLMLCHYCVSNLRCMCKAFERFLGDFCLLGALKFASDTKLCRKKKIHNSWLPRRKLLLSFPSNKIFFSEQVWKIHQRKILRRSGARGAKVALR